MKRRSGTEPAARRGETPVREILLEKGDWQVYTVSPDTSILEALAVMAEKDIGALIVTGGEEVVGVISERDCARRVLLEGKDPGRTTVAAEMNRDVCSVTANKTVSECIELMLRRHIRHLPVFFGRYLVGCVSLRCLLEHVYDAAPPPEKREKGKNRGAKKEKQGG